MHTYNNFNELAASQPGTRGMQSEMSVFNEKVRSFRKAGYDCLYQTRTGSVGDAGRIPVLVLVKEGKTKRDDTYRVAVATEDDYFELLESYKTYEQAKNVADSMTHEQAQQVLGDSQ